VTTLLEQHDAMLFDLDGTLFRGGKAVVGAPEQVHEVTRQSVRVGYLTNNGSRSADQVVAHLRSLGFPAEEREVVTSGQGAAAMLADRLPAGAEVLVVGTAALGGEVKHVGLALAITAEQAKAVVQGHSPDTAWRDLAEACLAIRAGALWVACNDDATLPDERGLLPGNGAMVAALRAATGAEPLVAGKPERPLFDEAIRRLAARRPLVVGDRLDTDIAGAVAAGLPSLLVLTGVSRAGDLLSAPRETRPSYVAADLAALHEDVDLLAPADQPSWQVRTSDGELTLVAGEGADPDGGDPVVALRALCAAHWRRGGGPTRVRAADDAAARALHALALPDTASPSPE
jgi:HAD superfamily hydrolase (TIGR01450 family)